MKFYCIHLEPGPERKPLQADVKNASGVPDETSVKTDEASGVSDESFGVTD
jgi:hypothetical protein